jgi:hypothetical protein
LCIKHWDNHGEDHGQHHHRQDGVHEIADVELLGVARCRAVDLRRAIDLLRGNRGKYLLRSEHFYLLLSLVSESYFASLSIHSMSPTGRLILWNVVAQCRHASHRNQLVCHIGYITESRV